MKKPPITVEGAEKLKVELQRLKSVDRPRIIQAIAEARAHVIFPRMPSITPPRSNRASPKGALLNLSPRCRRRR